MSKPTFLMPYFGSKFRLAPWIIGRFPRHDVYVEPFGGAGNVLIQKEPARSEIYNDLSGDVVNLFRVIRDEQSAQRLAELMEMTPYAHQELDDAYEAELKNADSVERARLLLVRLYMSFKSNGISNTKSTFEVRSSNSRSEAYITINRWNGLPQRIIDIAQRLKNVVIENEPAMKILKRYDSEDALFYVDPPYVHETRTGSKEMYQFEMDRDEHVALLERLLDMKSMIVLSGYDHPLYDEMLRGWKKEELVTQAMTAQPRTEILYSNTKAVEALQHTKETAGVLEWLTE